MAKHEFLSEEWIAAAEAVRDEFAGTFTSAPPPMKMNIVVTDVPFGEGALDAHIDTTSGEMGLEMGHVEGQDLTVTVDYATAKAVFIDQDQQASMQAFMAGKIKVQGDMTKMMAMQTVQPDAKQVEMSNKIAEFTA